MFSEKSKERLQSCHSDLQKLFFDVIQMADCAILCGHRDEADQAAACAKGNSNTPWPTSKHNSCPSLAVDVAPYPIDWNDIQRFKDFATLVKERASALGIAIRWGGDFRTLADYDHFELVESV